MRLNLKFKKFKMKRILTLSLMGLGAVHYAQSIGNTPYGAYGIGDVKYDNTIDITAMGGVSVAYVNDFGHKFNFSNPSANTNFNLSAFSIEATNENSFFKSNYGVMDSKKHSTYLSNISLAVPLSKKVKFGINYQPYSSKSYKVLLSETLEEGSYKFNRFQGKGTLSTVQAALGYHLSEAFALGVKTNFYFGKLYDIEEVFYNKLTPFVSGYETSHKVRTFDFTMGATYQKKLAQDRKITLGATYNFGATGNMISRYKNSTYILGGTNEVTNETIVEEKETQDRNLIPQKGSLGLGYGREGKWFYGTQVDFKKGRQIQYLGQPFELQNSYKIAVGGWILPNYNNFRNYFSRIIYRFGAYYEKGDLNLSLFNSTAQTNVNKMAVTGGLSLPFANANINAINGMDVGFEVGKRGTLKNNLINQTFVTFKLGLTFSDRWFQKRQYE